MGPIDVDFAAGQKVAVFGQASAGAKTLLEIIAGLRPVREGRILWDGASIGAMAMERRARQIAYVSSEANDDTGTVAAEHRLREFVALIHRSPSVWLFHEPAQGLPQESADGLVAALLNTSGTTTVILACDQPMGIELFDRVLHLHEGQIVFDGPPEKWRDFARNEGAALVRNVETPGSRGVSVKQASSSVAAEVIELHRRVR